MDLDLSFCWSRVTYKRRKPIATNVVSNLFASTYEKNADGVRVGNEEGDFVTEIQRLTKMLARTTSSRKHTETRRN